MYYLIKLSSGKEFVTGYLENLPEDTVEFTVVDANKTEEDGFPWNFHYKIGRKVYVAERDTTIVTGVNGIENVQDSTLYFDNYDLLNKAFINDRVMHDLMTR